MENFVLQLGEAEGGRQEACGAVRRERQPDFSAPKETASSGLWCVTGPQNRGARFALKNCSRPSFGGRSSPVLSTRTDRAAEAFTPAGRSPRRGSRPSGPGGGGPAPAPARYLPVRNYSLRGYRVSHDTDYIFQVFTVEEMMPHVQHMKGGHSKNLFLKDKKKKGFWLVTVLHNRQINLNDLAKKLGVGSGNLRFADENAMLEKLKVGQGCATPLALFCDQGEVRFVLDAGFLEGGHEKVYFHPMTNSATMGLSPDDFLKFVRSTGHDPIVIHFDEDIK
ncbi:PREDICTED: prolyl-tRNA synthetase associated domain-containing protein 1 [Aptenodytes forsteri]|nr:PREDICTED: prolyl-tRNA synthetase associated domain-containing protein 1 [Aptenodytes forsteri]